MNGPAIVLNPTDFDKLVDAIETRLAARITNEFKQLRGVMVEKAIGAKQACDILGIHSNTLYKMVKAEEIPFHRKGRALYFLPSELQQHMKKS
jgi:excisionase family DNA binding protein